MDVGLEVVNIEGIGRSADIALLIPICSSHSIEICHEHVMSDIEFALIVEKRTINILLNNVSLRSFKVIALDLFLCLSYQIIEFVDLINDDDSVASVAVLPWLDYPYISFFFLSLLVDVL